MTTGTQELPGSLLVKLTPAEPQPMVAGIMNILQTLPAGEQEQASSLAPGLPRRTLAGAQDTPARHQPQRVDKSNLLQRLE